MASPLTVQRNDYRTHPKSSTVYTPVGVAQFLFDVLQRPHSKPCLIRPLEADASPIRGTTLGISSWG